MVVQIVKHQEALLVTGFDGVNSLTRAQQLELKVDVGGLWMATYLDESLAKLEWFEGSIPWMYLDTRGNVTVGVGLLVPDAAAAQKLPFVFEGRAATAAETATEYARVHGMPMGRPAPFYRVNPGLE